MANLMDLEVFRHSGVSTYEQFVTPRWSDFAELVIRPGGPASRTPVKQKPQFIVKLTTKHYFTKSILRAWRTNGKFG